MALDFAVDGDVRFLTHLDMVRLFSRAVVRARLAIRFSEGFNPHPKLWLPLPRPLAVASDAERLVIELSEPVNPDDCLARLQTQMPPGVHLSRAQKLDAQAKPAPTAATYEVSVPQAAQDALIEAVDSFLSKSSYVVERTGGKKRSRPVDIRSVVERIELRGNKLEFTVIMDTGTSAKPAEVIRALGLDAEALGHRIRRTQVTWK